MNVLKEGDGAFPAGWSLAVDVGSSHDQKALMKKCKNYKIKTGGEVSVVRKK